MRSESIRVDRFGGLTRRVRLTAALAAMSVAAAAASAQPSARDFDIPPQDLATALQDFARQSDLQLVFRPELVQGRRSAGLYGNYPPAEALSRLMSGSGLTYRYDDRNTVIVVGTNNTSHEMGSRRGREHAMVDDLQVLAQLSDDEVRAQARAAQNDEADAGQDDAGDSPQGQTGTLEEIVVTSRRIEESIQSVGGGVTALGASELRNFRVSEADRLQEIAPNLVFKERDSARGLTIKVRGVGTSDADVPTADPTVAVYIDGVFQPRPFGPQFELFDLERVEILRGPQGTLYGKNALGGAINFITRRPDGEGGFRVRGEYGRFNEFNIEANGEIELISDRLFARVSGISRTRDGFFSNSAAKKQELATKNLQAGRLDLRYVDSDWDILLSGNLLDKDEVGVPFRLVEFGGVGALAAQLRGEDLEDFVIDADASHDARKSFPSDVGRRNGEFLPEGRGARGNPTSANRMWGATAIAERTGRSFDLNWTFGYQGFRNFDEADVDGTPVGILSRAVTDKGWNVNTELQLNAQFFDGKLDVVAGIFGMHEEFFTDQDNAVLEELLPLGVDASFNRRLDGNNDAAAVYTHAIYWITDSLNASLGLRFNHESKTLLLQQGRLTTPGQFQTINASDTQDFQNIQPKFGLDYRYNENLFFYGVVSRGFASGGFQGRPNPDLPKPESFDEETLWNFEVGIKSDWWNRRLRFNVSAFYMDWNDIVVQTFGPGEQLGVVGFFLENAGGAEIKGLEIESRVRPIPEVELGVNVGLLDQDFTDFGIGPEGPIDPDEANFFDSPDRTISVFASYTKELGRDRGEISMRADWSYRSEIFFDNAQTLVSGDDARDVLNASLGYTTPDGKWSVGLYGENLAGETFLIRNLNLLDGLGFNSVQFADPMTAGLFVEFNN